MADLCPSELRMNNAADYVASAWNYFDGRISNLIAEATNTADSLLASDLADVSFDSNILREETPITKYLCDLPDFGGTPDLTWITQDKDLNPELKWDINNYSVTNAPSPSFNESRWDLNLPSKPNVPTVPAPGGAPSVGGVVVPDAPDLVLPDDPTLFGITLPDVPDLNLPTWDVLAPDDTGIDAPTGSFNWMEELYSSDLLDKTTGVISWMQDGGTGIPGDIWNMIWDRAREQLSEERDRALEEATERWAARGFSVPGGALDKQIDTVIARFDKLSAEQLRETAIKQAQLEVENLRFSVESGIKLEGQLLSYWAGVQQRSLEAAKTIYEVAIALFNAKIAKYNADAQVYQTQAQVHKTLIEAELANLEIYKAEIEGQKLIGDLNQQSVSIYATKVDALAKVMQMYVAEIEGVKAQVELDKTRIQAYATEVQAYGERVKANALEYEAYKTQVQAETSKSELYKAQVSAFSSRVDAWDKKQRNELAADDIELKEQQSIVSVYEAALKDLDMKIKQEAARLDSSYKTSEYNIKAYDSAVKALAARGDIELKAEELRLRDAIDLQLKKYLTELDIAVKQADLQNRLQIDSVKAAAQVQSQLAAATMSAVNFSASMSDSFSSGMSKSASCSQSVSV